MSSLSVSYDGELVKETDSWLFKAIPFGDANCEPVCDEDEESHVEIFLQRYCGSGEDIDWELSLHSPQNGSSFAAAGSFPGCNNDDTIFFYESVCVPKDSCATFSMNTTSDDIPIYSLTMDDVTYRSGQWNTLSKLNETINIGSCTAGMLCGSDQTLFELELQTPSAYSVAGKPAAVIDYAHIDWTLDYSDPYKRPIAGSLDYVDRNAAYDLGSVYRTVECVPDTKCELQLTMTVDSFYESTPPLERYAMKRNGITIVDQAGADQTDTELFGEDCNGSTSSSKVSGGVIVGIVLATLLHYA